MQCSDKVYLQCGSSHDVLNLNLYEMFSHTQSTCNFLHQCVSSDVLLNSADVKNSFHTKNMNKEKCFLLP